MSEPRLAEVGAVGARIAAATSLEAVIDATLLGVDELLGHGHSLLLVHAAESDRLVTLASRGYDMGGVGSEVAVGEGVIGMAAAKLQPMRVANLQRMLAYASAVQRSADGDDHDIRLPGLPAARSQLAAPMVTRAHLVGVLAVESEQALAFDDADEAALAIVALLAGAAIDREQLAAAEPDVVPPATEGASDPTTPARSPERSAAARSVRLRHFAVDGSTFLDDEYLIRGVAGRLLWKLASEHATSGRTSFTNREVRLDPELELPAFRDNFESRLILLKRRLEERDAPLRIVGEGRGRFALVVDAVPELERVERPS